MREESLLSSRERQGLSRVLAVVAVHAAIGKATSCHPEPMGCLMQQFGQGAAEAEQVLTDMGVEIADTLDDRKIVKGLYVKSHPILMAAAEVAANVLHP